MNNLQALTDIGHEAAGKGMHLVRDFWQRESPDEVWRIWRKPEEWMEQVNGEQKEAYQKEMKTRRIPIRSGPYILRWGYKTKGNFSIKEAYQILSTSGPEDLENTWKQIWNSNWWPKVTHFIWLVIKGRILTWDQLQKRGFQGPPDVHYANKNKKLKNIYLTYAQKPSISGKRLGGCLENQIETNKA